MKASELVIQVTNEIRTYPARFSNFLEVLQAFIWLEDVLKLLITVYDKLKAEDVKTTSTEGMSRLQI